MKLEPLDVTNMPREELPELLGDLVTLEARVRLRLAEIVPASQATVEERLLNADEAATIAGTTRRWLLAKTRGLRFRADLSRKQARFREAGLRRWLEGRRR